MHLPWCSGCASTLRNVEPAFFSRCRLISTRPPIGSSGCESRQAASVCDAKVQRRRQTRLRDATASVAAAGRRRAIWRGRSTYERASVCERPKGRKRVCSSARPGSGALTVVMTARVSRHASARGSEARDAAAVSALLWRLCFRLFLEFLTGSVAVAGTRSKPSGWVNDFATCRKRLVQTYACSGRLLRWCVSFLRGACCGGWPCTLWLRVAAAGTLLPSLLSRASPLAPSLLEQCQKARRFCVGVHWRSCAARRVRPAGGSGTEWTLFTPARAVFWTAGMWRRVRVSGACTYPTHQTLRTHVLQPASLRLSVCLRVCLF